MQTYAEILFSHHTALWRKASEIDAEINTVIKSCSSKISGAQLVRQSIKDFWSFWPTFCKAISSEYDNLLLELKNESDASLNLVIDLFKKYC